jgi:NADH-ubiquinone oxidoreductase chain 5
MEDSILMFIPMFFLSFFSIIIGYLSSELFLGVGQDFWKDTIYIAVDHFF